MEKDTILYPTGYEKFTPAMHCVAVYVKIEDPLQETKKTLITSTESATFSEADNSEFYPQVFAIGEGVTGVTVGAKLQLKKGAVKRIEEDGIYVSPEVAKEIEKRSKYVKEWRDRSLQSKQFGEHVAPTFDDSIVLSACRVIPLYDIAGWF